MIRFLIALVLSILFCYVGVTFFIHLGASLIADWSSSEFLSRVLICLNAWALFSIFIAGLALGFPLFLFWENPKTLNNEKHIRWWVTGVFLVFVLITIFSNPFSYVIFIVGVGIITYWTALKPIDFPLVKTRLLQFSGAGAAVLFITGVGIALFGFANTPSNYSGRRLIELMSYGSGQLTALEREFSIASGAVVFGGILVAVAIALTVWLIAMRRK